MKKERVLGVIKSKGFIASICVAAGFITGVLATDSTNTQEYNALVDEFNVNVEDYNTLLEEYNTLETETAEWVGASEEDKQAWRNLTEQEKAKLQEEQARREEEAKQKELEEQRKATEGVNVYEDSKVKINFLQTGYDGMTFLVENKTDKLLTIQADSVAVNGYSTDDITMSDDVAPQSKGKVIAKCSLEEYDAKTISGQLRVIDFSSMDSYDVTFTNVNVE